MLRNVGVVGATGALLTGPVPKSLFAAEAPKQTQEKPEEQPGKSSLELLKEHEDYVAVLEAGEMVVHFDRRYGSISSITRKGDPLETNYIGNEINTPGVDPSDSRWTGDVVSTVWELTDEDWMHPKLGQNDVFHMSGRWRKEVTGVSDDNRRVSVTENAVKVQYEGVSSNAQGIRSYSLAMSYSAGAGNSLVWDIEIGNTSGKVLEIGELGLPLMVNNDYEELYIQHGSETKLSTVNNVDFGKTPLRQKLIHEQKVLVHHFIAGHSSYALLQRPLGDAPYLLIHPTMDTSFECMYKEPDLAFTAHVRGWEGPDILAIHSRATKDLRRWRSNPWVNGHTSLILQPGEKKKFQLRFALIPSYEAIADELHEAGNLGIRVLPSMVVQEDTDVLVELKTKSEIGQIDLLSDNIELKEKKTVGDKALLTLSFKGRGQKSLKLHYGEGRWTNLHFYCIEDIEGLLNARGQFIVDRQFYKNPQDPYHRNHCFLPLIIASAASFWIPMKCGKLVAATNRAFLSRFSWRRRMCIFHRARKSKRLRLTLRIACSSTFKIRRLTKSELRCIGRIAIPPTDGARGQNSALKLPSVPIIMFTPPIFIMRYTASVRAMACSPAKLPKNIFACHTVPA